VLDLRRRQFLLRSASAPEVDERFSGVVYILDEGGKGYAYVRFSAEFVRAVGKEMPRGVSPDSPGYLKVMRTANGAWKVFALYVGEEEGVLLCEVKDRPLWLGKTRRS
jgi:hypothetical protein